MSAIGFLLFFWFQSTRPRGARPSCIGGLPPVRGFNPRAREGRDFPPPVAGCGAKCFNPRAREGRDSQLLRLLEAAEVSIHAPARGATIQIICRFRRIYVSIHAPARGATPLHFP